MPGSEPNCGSSASPSRRSLLCAAGAGCVLGAAALTHLAGATAAAGQASAAQAPAGARTGHTVTPDDRARVDPGGVSRVPVDRPWVALTFDDGPDPDYTPAVLDILERHQARATFFVVGRNAAAHPDLIARIRAGGHALANHTQNHRWLDGLTEPEVRAEMTLGGAHVDGSTLFRPPRGWTSATVTAVSRDLGLRSVFWSDCVEAHFEWGTRGAGKRVGFHAGPGSIILTHDGGRITGPSPQGIDRTRSVEALPHLLGALRQRDLAPVTLPELLAAARPRLAGA